MISCARRVFQLANWIFWVDRILLLGLCRSTYILLGLGNTYLLDDQQDFERVEFRITVTEG